MARFTRWLAEALDTGLSLPSALQLAAEAGGRGTLHRAAYRLADAASQENFQLSQSATALCLPATVLHALQAGSGGAPSIALLRKLSELYSTRVRSRHAWSHSYLYPLAIFVVGVMVGMVVLALFVPMVGLVNGLTG
jgi:type IV pilus assembly protein PilC